MQPTERNIQSPYQSIPVSTGQSINTALSSPVEANREDVSTQLINSSQWRGHSVKINSYFFSKAYVTNSGDDDVSVIDVATDTVMPTTITVEDKPRGIAITPLGNLEVSGDCCKSNFLTQTELFVAITWSSFINGDVVILQYSIFRDGELIATIPATDPRQFTDHNRKRNSAYTYTVVAEDLDGAIAEGSISMICH